MEPLLISNIPEINEKIPEVYGDKLYITDVPEHEGEQLLLKDISSLDSEDPDQFIMLTETPIEENPLRSEGERIPEEQLMALDRQVNQWAKELGGTFYRIFPPNKAELDHASLSLTELTSNMNLDGQEVNPSTTEGYKQIAVYSNSIQGKPNPEPITYIMLDVQGEPQVWVTEQTDVSKQVRFNLSENAEMTDIFNEWHDKAFESESDQDAGGELSEDSLAAMLENRHADFDSEQALAFVKQMWFPKYTDLELQMGSQTVYLEENLEHTVTIEEKAPGYYYFNQSSGAMTQSFDFFMYGNNFVTLRQAYEPMSYSLIDSKTYENIASENLTDQEAKQFKEAEANIGVAQP